MIASSRILAALISMAVGARNSRVVRVKLERETGLTSLVPSSKSNSFIGFGIDLEST